MGVGKSNRPTWCPSFLVSSLFPILLRFDSFRDNSCVPPTPPPISPLSYRGVVILVRVGPSSWTLPLGRGTSRGTWYERSFHSSLWLCGMTMSLVKLLSFFLLFPSLLFSFLFSGELPCRASHLLRSESKKREGMGGC